MQYPVSKEIAVLPNVEVVLKYVIRMCCLHYALILLNLLQNIATSKDTLSFFLEDLQTNY